MKLFLISPKQDLSYDAFDSAVVAAKDETAARNIHPYSPQAWDAETITWASTPEQVRVELIGTAKPGTKSGVICASFNAG